MRIRIIQNVALVVALLAPAASVRAGWQGGVGVLGDSYSDEYRFYAPHRSTARNWVEMLAATRGLDFGAYSDAGRGEPRNQGYAYNWARSDAETQDMIATGQHTGLAAQVARGEVSLVVIFVGGNDFIHAMKKPDPVAALGEAGPRAEKNLGTALETILAASPRVRVVLVTVPDIRNLPEFRDPLRDGRLPGAQADAATEVVRRYNARVRALAARESQRVALLDFDLFTRISERVYPEYLMVAGRPIERAVPSDEVDHLFLGDVRHLGTVGQGLFASTLVATVNAKFDAGLAPLTEREVIDFAAAHGPSSRGLAHSSVEGGVNR
jgi:hypothetical protein